MRRSHVILLLSIVSLAFVLPCAVSAAGKGRALSLKMLDATVKSGSSEFAEKLCGISRIAGYVYDRSQKDVVLIGYVDPSYPPLYLQDFVVAVRNARMAYAVLKGNTYYYSSPGCSIDPDPRVLRELDEAGDRFSASRDPGEKRRRLEEWKAIGRQPQSVRVLGVPFDTRFAKVMVDADYYMKRLVDGSVSLDIPGFESLMDVREAISKREMEQGINTPYHSMSRFWFYPGDSTYTEDEGMILLKKCPVKLLTEEEFLTSQGQIQGKGSPNELAQNFADSFTVHYNEIAKARPVYKELEQLFRFAAIARLMNEDKVFESSGVKYLPERYVVPKVPVSRKVNGLTNVKEMVTERETSEGTITHYLWHMSCGGVSMDVRPRRVASSAVKPDSKSYSSAGKKPSNGKPAVRTGDAGLKKKVLQSRQSDKSLYWDVEIPE